MLFEKLSPDELRDRLIRIRSLYLSENTPSKRVRLDVLLEIPASHDAQSESEADTHMYGEGDYAT